jgi:hypothetical protein
VLAAEIDYYIELFKQLVLNIYCHFEFLTIKFIHVPIFQTMLFSSIFRINAPICFSGISWGCRPRMRQGSFATFGLNDAVS